MSSSYASRPDPKRIQSVLFSPLTTHSRRTRQMSSISLSEVDVADLYVRSHSSRAWQDLFSRPSVTTQSLKDEALSRDGLRGEFDGGVMLRSVYWRVGPAFLVKPDMRDVTP